MVEETACNYRSRGESSLALGPLLPEGAKHVVRSVILASKRSIWYALQACVQLTEPVPDSAARALLWVRYS